MPSPINKSIKNSNMTTPAPIQKDDASKLKSQAKTIKIITVVGAVALSILGIVAAVLMPVSIPFVIAGLLGVAGVTAGALNLDHILKALQKQKANPEIAPSVAAEPSEDTIAVVPTPVIPEEATIALTKESRAEVEHKTYLKQCDNDISEARNEIDNLNTLLKNIKTNHLYKPSLLDKISIATKKLTQLGVEKNRALGAFHASMSKGA
jgi:hypothetical protein